MAMITVALRVIKGLGAGIWRVVRGAFRFIFSTPAGPWVLALLLAAAMVFSWSSLHTTRTQLANTQQTLNEVEQRATVQRERARALANTLAEYQERSEELAEANEALQTEVRRAVENNEEWSRVRTPDDVVDSLCGTFRCE